jgi:predicted RNase H-related nuclease YkuK (DUF458 family)
MDQEQIEDFLNYFDETRVIIRFVDVPGEPGADVWFIDFVPEGKQSGRDEIVHEIERALVDSDGYPVAHVLDIRGSHLDWGASAATQEILVEVTSFVLEQGAEAAIDTGKLAAGAGLKMLWDKWCRRKLVSQDWRMIEGVEDAKAAALERLEQAYGVPAQDITLTSESSESDARQWIFQFQDVGHQYEVVLGLAGDDVVTARISRKRRANVVGE